MNYDLIIHISLGYLLGRVGFEIIAWLGRVGNEFQSEEQGSTE